MNTNPAGKGIFSTELWVALFARAGGIYLTYLIISGKITANDSSGFTNVIIATWGLLAPIFTDAKYIQSRTAIKTQLLNQTKLPIDN